MSTKRAVFFSNIHFEYHLSCLVLFTPLYLPVDMTSKMLAKESFRKPQLLENCHSECQCESKTVQMGLSHTTIKDTYTPNINV